MSKTEKTLYDLLVEMKVFSFANDRIERSGRRETSFVDTTPPPPGAFEPHPDAKKALLWRKSHKDDEA